MRTLKSLRRRSRLWLLALAAASVVLLAALADGAGTAAAHTYYLSPSGNDHSVGTSLAHAWRTLARASRLRPRPGDRILLQGGASFAGTLRVIVAGRGNPRAPVVIGSYGPGDATIEAGGSSAVEVLDSSGVRVERLVLRGSGASTNTGSGVLVLNDLRGGVALRAIRVAGVSAEGFGFAGIAVYGAPRDGSQSGYRGVAVNDCQANANRYYGIYVNGVEDPQTSRYANAEVSIRRCSAARNEGNPDYPQKHSGNGIFMGDVDGGVISESTAHDNGALNSCEDCGPAGIWAANAHAVRIEHDESYSNRSGPGGHDGDGFDLDGGTTDCVLQYDYSHDNDGAGLMVYGYAGAPHSVDGNTIRYDISRDDGRRGGYPGILLSGNGQAVTDSAVYGNSVALTPPRGGSPAAFEAVGSVSASVRSNAFSTRGGLPLVRVLAPQPGLTFQGNDYWTAGEPALFEYGSATFGSLDAWSSATGQERGAGGPLGSSVAPEGFSGSAGSAGAGA